MTKNYKKLEKIHQEYQHNPLLIASLYLERVPKDDVQWANNGTSTDLVRDTMNKKIKELVADTKEISDELSLEILRTQKPILDKTNLEYLYYFEKKVKIKQLLKGII